MFFGTAGVGNELLVDDMVFWYGSVGLPVIGDKLNTVFTYPNPVTNELHIDLELSDADVVLHVYDLSGQLLIENKYGNLNGKQTLSVDVSKLGKGSYILSVTDMNENSFV